MLDSQAADTVPETIIFTTMSVERAESSSALALVVQLQIIDCDLNNEDIEIQIPNQ